MWTGAGLAALEAVRNSVLLTAKSIEIGSDMVSKQRKAMSNAALFDVFMHRFSMLLVSTVNIKVINRSAFEIFVVLVDYGQQALVVIVIFKLQETTKRVTEVGLNDTKLLLRQDHR